MPTSKLPGAQSKYYACANYGHSNELPNYRRDVSVPHTLPGYFAHTGGCPCPPDLKKQKINGHSVAETLISEETPSGQIKSNRVNASLKGNVVEATARTGDKTRAFRGADGPHSVSANGIGLACAPANTDTRLAKRASAKAHAAALERKRFLRAVLNDETLARLDAEGQRAAVEQALGWLAPHHAAELEAQKLNNYNPRINLNSDTDGNHRDANALHKSDLPKNADTTATTSHGSAQPCSFTQTNLTKNPSSAEELFYGGGLAREATVASQFNAVLEELRFVAAQPVQSKETIVRLKYLVEEIARAPAGRGRGVKQLV